jgi:hypothetical protein
MTVGERRLFLIVSWCTHFWQHCSQGRSIVVWRELLYKARVVSSLILFILRCVFADLGEYLLCNIMYLVLKVCNQMVHSKAQILLIQ